MRDEAGATSAKTRYSHIIKGRRMQESIPNQAELKLTVARILEVSYRTDAGITAKLMREAGRVTVSVDHTGMATITGRAGVVVVSVAEATDALGVYVRAVTILMSADGSGGIRYNAEFRLGVAAVGVSGSIDIERLILSCSGLVCRAARMLNGRSDQLNRQLLEAMGH